MLSVNLCLSALLIMLVMLKSSCAAIYSNIDLATFASGPAVGIRIIGAVSGDQAGYKVCSAGDYNGDSLADVMVSSPTASVAGKSNAGLTVVLFGHNSSALDLDIDLNVFTSGATGFKILGPAISANLGAGMSGVGDVNGDSIDDIAIGAPGIGVVFLLYGRSYTLGAFEDVNLAFFTSGPAGMRIVGPFTSMFGISISNIGTYNSGALNDFVIGAPSYGNNYAGAVFIIFGSVTVTSDYTVGGAGGSRGFMADSTNSGGQCGMSVSTAGDIDGDGLTDVIIGCPGINRAVVLFGRLSTPSSSVHLMDVDDEDGFTLRGNFAANDKIGFSVSGGKDLNGDNMPDIVVGGYGTTALGRPDAGITYVIYGRSSSTFDTSIQLSSSMGASVGYIVYGASSGGGFGCAVSVAGDVNGDGIGDYIVGAFAASPPGKAHAGITYVLFGNNAPSAAAYDLSYLTTSNYNRGFFVRGASANDNFGSAVSNVGDFNGDGIDDVIVGSPMMDISGRSEVGAAFIIYGEKPSVAPSILPTAAPSFAPSRAPTAKPTTAAPSCQPSVKPSPQPSTFNPSRQPSVKSTVCPSASPSVPPSADPSVDPSTSPTLDPSAGPSAFPSVGPSAGPSVSPSAPPSANPSMAPSVAPSVGPSVPPSVAPSFKPSASPSVTPTLLPSAPPTAPPSVAPSFPPSVGPTAAPTLPPSNAPSAGPSQPPSPCPSAGPSVAPSLPPSAPPSAQPTVPPTAPPTAPPSTKPSCAPTLPPSSSPTAGPSQPPSLDPSAAPTLSPSQSPTVRPTQPPSAPPSPSGPPSRQPSFLPTVLHQPVAVPTVNPTSGPTPLPTRNPTANPTWNPTINPTANPTANPTVNPTRDPTVNPSVNPTRSPSAMPSFPPSFDPSAGPTRAPSTGPSVLPTAVPTANPSADPGANPSKGPTLSPSVRPSANPSAAPSCSPTPDPSSGPTEVSSLPLSAPPSAGPSANPSAGPTTAPSAGPSVVPSTTPSVSPSADPSAGPSEAPTLAPSVVPTTGPTIVPTVVPTADRTVRPTALPSASAVPSVTPSRLPSARPSAWPTVAPTAEPSDAPTPSPSESPSAGPSVNPTAVPSTAPSVHPSLAPTEDPTVDPTMNPSVEPSVDPSVVPSAAPSVDPSVAPSAAPTVSPTVEPTSDPSAAPSESPTAPPTTASTDAPSAAPSSGATMAPSHAVSLLPSVVPSTGPTTEQSAVPSPSATVTPTGVHSAPSSSPTVAEVTATPSVAPSVSVSAGPSAGVIMVPSEAPTSTPTVHGTSAPTAVPSVETAPSAGPLARPTRDPSASPTADPSIAASAEPSVMPSATPVANPTARPSSPPSVSPSSAPTVLPSVGPGQTVSPSRLPTTAPSASQEQLWRAKLTDTLTAAVARRSADEAYRSTYYELDVGSSANPAVYGSCSGWKNFVFSELTSASLQYIPTSIELIAQGSLTSADAPVRCENASSVAVILGALSKSTGGRTELVCGSHKWVTNTCDGVTALCVDCADPCAVDSHCLEFTSAYSIAPCVASACAGGSSVVSAVRVLSMSYKDASPAPVILRSSTTHTKSSIAVTAKLDMAGSVFCAAYTNAFAPTSVSALVMQNFVASTNAANVSVVVVGGLQAASTYTVYCAAQSAAGTWMSLQSVLSSAPTVTTDCCNTIQVQAAASSVTEASLVRDFVSVVLASRPASDMKVVLSLVDSAGKTVSPAPFFPSTFTIAAQQVTAGVATASSKAVTLTSTLQSLPAGTYTYNVTISGEASGRFEVDFTSGVDTLTVLPASSPLPAPVLTSAQLANDGSHIAIRFDSNTDKGGASSAAFACSTLLEFACAASSSCTWASSREIQAFVSTTSGCAGVGSAVSLAPSPSIKAQCQLVSGCDTSAWASADATRVVNVVAPDSAVSPTVVIKAPTSIGGCSSLTLDLTGSSGNGGRPWLSRTITVDTAATLNVTDLRNFLATTYTLSPPSPIPAALLSKGYAYNFVVKLCNFLDQCSEVSRKVVVQSGAVPTVSLDGGDTRAIQRSNALSVSSDAFYADCNNVVTRGGLSYKWTVSQGGVEIVGLQSQSKDPSKLIIAANTLTTNTMFGVRLQVTKLNSLLSNSALVQVFVQPGALRAVVAQGTSRSVRTGESLRIDASASFDEDQAGVSGAAAGLSFAWSCEQLSPVLRENCDSILSGFSYESGGGVLSAQAGVDVANSVAQITLVVQDASKSRSTQSVITVNVVPSLAPVVSLTANVAASGVFNSNQELQLTGTVGLPASLNGTVTWSVDESSGFSLSAAAKSPLAVAMPAASSAQLRKVYMVLGASSLPGRSTLTFVLTARAAGVTQTSIATVVVTVNAAPLVGAFAVTPLSGTEITDPFTFAATQWFDDNLPLQYQFAQVSVSGVDVTLRSKAESAFGVSTLTAGLKGNNFTVTCVVTVFDSLTASTRSTSTVTVHKLALTSSDQLSDLITGGLSDGVSSADGLKQATSLGSYLLNDIDCSSAPDCASRNRKACHRTQNTCGECVSASYVGDTGDSNEICVAVASLRPRDSRGSRHLLTATEATIDACMSSADCSPFETCSGGLCAPQLKACINNCSSPHGTCQYANADTGDAVVTCYVGAIDCVAVCHCADEYAGSSICSLNSTELLAKQVLRTQVIEGVAKLVALEDADKETVEGWISSIVASSQVPDELTTEATALLLQLSQTVLEASTRAGVSVDSVTNLLQAVDNIAQAHKNDVWRRRQLSTKSAISNTTLVGLQHTLSQFQSFVLDNILPDQDAVTVTSPQFRLHVAKLSRSTSSSDVTVTLPRSDLEVFNNQAQSAVSLPTGSGVVSDDDVVGVSLVSMRAELVNAAHGLIGTEQAFSNPLTVDWSGSSVCSDPSCRFELILQTSVAFDGSILEQEAPIIFNTTCAAGEHTAHHYTCPDHSVLSVSCPGDSVTIISRCNVTSYSPTCSGVGAFGVSGSGCNVVSRSPTNITCSCPLSALTGRRLQTDDGEAASETSVSYVAMLSEVQHSFVDTIISAQGLDASSVKEGWSAIVTVGSLAAALLFGLLWAHNADQDMRKTRPDKKELVIGSKSHKDAEKQGILARWVFGAAASDRRRSRKSGTRGIDKDVQIAEQALPAILRSNQLSNRVTDEIKHHHKYIGIVFFFSTSFPRTLRVLSLAMNVIIMLFMQSLTYSLTNPDDGLCETYATKPECLEPSSPYATGEPKCFWTQETGECALAEPDSSLRVILFVAIFSALVSTPVALAVDWVILSVLAAPTKVPTVSGGDVATQRVQGRSSVPRTGLSPSATTPGDPSAEELRVAVPVTTVSQRRSVRSSRILSVGSWKGSTVGIESDVQQNMVNISAQNDLRALIAGLHKYRDSLVPAERIEFDTTWGLDENGSFRTDEETQDTWCGWLSSKLATQGGGAGTGSVAHRVLMDLRQVHSSLLSEEEIATSQRKSAAEKGRRLLYLFQRDLLPGISGKILESKGQRDNLTTQSVSWNAKVAGWAVLLLMSIGMLFYILLFALSQTTHRQGAWAMSFVLWLCVDVFLVSSSIVIFTHILVPSLIMKDVSKIKQKLVDSIRDFNAGVQHRRHLAGRDDEEEEEEEFNAASFLFVSTRLAKEWSDLREAKIIAQFRTPWPKQSYQRDVDVSAVYSKRYTALYRSASVVAVFFLAQVLQVPPGLQDMIIHMVTTSAVGYTILLHIDLYTIFPLLAFIPLLLVAVIVHFMIRSRRAAAEQELSKVLAVPQAPVLRRESLKHLGNRTGALDTPTKSLAGIVLGDDLYDVDVEAKYDTELHNAPFTSREQQWMQMAKPADEQDDGELLIPAVPSLHTTRRQSVQQGLRVVERLRLETQQSLTSVPEEDYSEEDSPVNATKVRTFSTHYEGSSDHTDTPLHTPLPSARPSHVDGHFFPAVEEKHDVCGEDEEESDENDSDDGSSECDSDFGDDEKEREEEEEQSGDDASDSEAESDSEETDDDSVFGSGAVSEESI